MRTLTIILVICGFSAWAVSIALKLPDVQWFAYALWAAIAVGLLLRSIRGRRKAAKAVVDAADEVQDMYLGRSAPTIYPFDPKESAQYGKPPDSNPITLPTKSTPHDPR
ncbi:MAG: hypothetical protein FWE39_16720 [Nocardiaceae bacterium]|nr:hypothetical protein [Microbacteriaceae bacterium]MCL2535803.1 hypothetical protein [Nocardiaceae bacterium]